MMQKLLRNAWYRPLKLFDGNKKDEILDKIKQIPLCDSTAMRRTEILAEDLVLQLNKKLKSTNCISLAIDESTDVTDDFLTYSLCEILG